MRQSAIVTGLLMTGAGGSAAANFLDAIWRANPSERVVGGDASATMLHLSDANDRVTLPWVGRDPEAWIDAVNVAVETYELDVVHAQPDPEVLVLGRCRDRIKACTFLPSQGAMETAADKQQFALAMEAAGVLVPESVGVTGWDQLRVVTSDLLERHRNVWVRSRVGAGSLGALPVSEPNQAAAWITWWVEERGFGVTDFMVSERLPGREFAYQSIWRDGVLLAGQTRERVQYLFGHLTPSGQSSTPAVARTVDLPAIDDLAMAAVRALDPIPNGVMCVDLKEDEGGTAKVTEINCGRFFTTSNFFAAAGLNMPDMLLRCARGQVVEPVGSSPLDADLYWIRMVDMGYRLVAGDQLDRWDKPG